MTKTRKRSVVAVSLLLFGAAGCVDLNVTNVNDPDAARALSRPKDVESLIAGAYGQYWNSQHHINSIGFILSVQSFQHSAFPANWGMYLYSEYPRSPIQNETAHGFYLHWANPWSWNYRGIAAIRDGLSALNGGVNLGGDDRRARAYAKFMQGIHHGTIALLFEQGYVVDETTDLAALEVQPYGEVMTAALGYLDEAIALSSGTSFTIPADWMSVSLSNDQLRRLAHSFKARFRADVARDRAERSSVNWDLVIADAAAGITSDFNMDIDWGAWWNYAGFYMTWEAAWSQLHYQILGMADQSNKYQTWINQPVAARHPNLGTNTPFTIVTPDNRFPAGATLAEQRASPGRYFFVPSEARVGANWGQEARGTHRWSYYGDFQFMDWRINDGPFPHLRVAELRLLQAEGHLWRNRPGQAADLINVSRTAAGLSPTDAAGTNASCVPKLPNGACGDLWEMYKWEMRLETRFAGTFHSPWYFQSRGWGDLYRGTQLDFGIPCRDADMAGLPCRKLGGVGGERASPGSSYGWVGE
jgi:starch-binding outer membrane protein, SusD/RagB family